MRSISAFLRKHSIYVLSFYIFLFVVILGSSFLFYLTNQRQSEVLHEARSYAQTLTNIHAYYSDRILPLAQFQGIGLTTKPNEDPGKLPFPGSFIRQAGQNLTQYNTNLEVELFSAYPLGESYDRVLDPFQKIALDLFESDEADEYGEVIEKRDERYFRYARPSFMEASCVLCHNQQQRQADLDYPIWKIGDIRGALEITIKYPPLLRDNETVFWLFGACIVITLMFSGVIILPMQRSMANAIDDAQHLSTELDVRNRILLEQNKEKNNFLANVSHELRTPLNAIIGFADIQKREMYGPLGHDKYKGYNGDIIRSGNHLLGLIDNLLDVSQLETGDQHLHESPIHYGRFMDDVKAMTEAAVHRANMSINFRVAKNLPTLIADERALKQVMINLIINASKYSQGHNVMATIDKSDGKVFMSVIDDGVGIEKDKLNHLTRRFFRATDAKQSGKGGFGIGLWLVDAICQAHGAELVISSKLGEGSEFRVVFPHYRLVELDPSVHTPSS